MTNHNTYSESVKAQAMRESFVGRVMADVVLRIAYERGGMEAVEAKIASWGQLDDDWNAAVDAIRRRAGVEGWGK